MTREGRFVHIGKKSWWNGVTRTLCGEKYEGGDKIRFPKFFGYTVCPACERIHKANGGR
jgi:hypothetical protein